MILKPVEESRSEDVSIHRRHSSNSRHKRKSQATVTPSEFNPNSPRVRSKYKEVHTRTHSTNIVSGYDDRLEGNENLSTKGKDRENQKRMQICPAPHPHSPTDVTSNRTSDIITPSCLYSTSSYQSSTKSKDPGSMKWIIQLSGDYGVRSEEGPSMVDTTTGSSSWSSHCSNIPTNSPHLQ